ncbi:hypothetical protein ACQKMD_01085 [Viridibacillus sp. NPDC096237]|uniref:hypothetical protein n=1 Tax=Viridibacillus sp. NPDC096237 TaxID=3390721 RepID=UPI003CFDF20C
MRAPTRKKYGVLIYYLYGRELEFETNINILEAQEQGDSSVELEDGRHIDLTNIERIITAEK